MPGGGPRAATGALPGRHSKPRPPPPPPRASGCRPRRPRRGPRSGARESPTLTGEELLDARKATARPTEEDAGYEPGEAHGDDQGHDAEGT